MSLGSSRNGRPGHGAEGDGGAQSSNPRLTRVNDYDFDDLDYDDDEEESSVDASKPLKSPSSSTSTSGPSTAAASEAEARPVVAEVQDPPSHPNSEAVYAAVSRHAAQAAKAARSKSSPTLELWNSVSNTLNGNPMRVFLLVLGVLVFVFLNPPSRTTYSSARDVLSRVQEVPILKDAFSLVGISSSKPKNSTEAETHTSAVVTLTAASTRNNHTTSSSVVHPDTRQQSAQDEDDEEGEENEEQQELQQHSAEPSNQDAVVAPKTVSAPPGETLVSPQHSQPQPLVSKPAPHHSTGTTPAATHLTSTASSSEPEDGVRELPDLLTPEGQARRAGLSYLGMTDEEIFAAKARQAQAVKAVSQTAAMDIAADGVNYKELVHFGPKQLVKEALIAKDPHEAQQIAAAAGVLAAKAGVAGVDEAIVRLPPGHDIQVDEHSLGNQAPLHPAILPPAPLNTTRYKVLPVNIFEKIKSQIPKPAPQV